MTDDHTTPGSRLLDPAMRRIIATTKTSFRAYDRHGATRHDMEYLPLGDEHTASAGGAEVFLVRFKPGAASTPHEHSGGEEFYVLEGELTDCDGIVLQSGDYVRYQPGSRHFSVSEKGCTLLVILGGRNITLPEEVKRQA